MASTIIIKNGAGSSTPSSLKQGEFAINVDSGKLFYGTSGSSNAVSSSFSFQHVTASGEVSASKVIADTISGGVGQNGLTLIGDITASGDINTTGIYQVEGVNAIDYAASTHLFGANSSFMKLRSTKGIEMTAAVTASSNISASGDLAGNSLTIKDAGVSKASIDASGNVSANSISTEADIQHVGDTNNKISFGTDTQDFQTGGSSRLDISDSGVRLGGANSRVTTILDEDNMASDSDTSLATQQSIKAYVDANAGGGSVSGNTFATDLKIGRDADNLIDFTTDNQVTFRVSANDGIVMKASGEIEATKFDGALEGNADTATALATARNIGGVSFDGTGDIDLPGVNSAGNQNTSGTAAIATTVTVTDNESTNEDNVITFVAGAAGSGNVGLEADGDLTYNPSTGKLAATNLSSSGVLNANTVQLAHNGVNTLNVSNAGAISASSTIQGTAFTAQTNGVTKATIDASGNISASGTITTATLVGHGTDTVLAVSGKISASNALLGQELSLASNGTTHSSISTDGSASFNGGITTGHAGTASLGLVSASRLVAQGTDAGANIALLDNDGNSIAQFARIGTGTNAHIGRMVLRDNADTKVDIRASGTSYIMGAFSSSGAIEANSFSITNNGDNVFSITNAGAISASSTIAGTTLTLATNGVTKAAIDASGNIAAEGAISSSGKLSGTDIDLRTNGAQVFAVNTDGIVNAEGGISSSGELHGNSIAITNNGDAVFKVSNAGAVSASGELAGGSLVLKQNGLDRASIDTSGDFTCRTISGSGQLIANTAQFKHNGIDTLNISNAGAISASSTIQGTAFTAQTNGATKATIDASGNIAAEGAISSSGLLSGTSLDIKSAGVQKTSIDTSGNVSASKYVNQDIVLSNQVVFFSNPARNEITTGNTNHGFDSDSIGGIIEVDDSPASITIAGNEAHGGFIVPFDITQIDLKAYYRPAQTSGTAPFNGTTTSAVINSGDDMTFEVHIYESDRPDANNSNITLTRIGVASDTLAAGEKNKHFYTCDLSEPIATTVSAGKLIHVGFEFSSADASVSSMTGNVKASYILSAGRV